MKNRNSIADRHDRGSVLCITSIAWKTGGLIRLRGGLASWFRALELAAGQASLDLMNRWFVGISHFRLIPVVDSARYRSTEHLRPWGHVVRT